MATPTKDEVLQMAQEYGVNLDGLKWQEQIKAVYAAKKSAESNDVEYVADTPVESQESIRRKKNMEYGRRMREELDGKEFTIAPMIRPELQNVRFKYKERLGKEKNVQEVYFDLNHLGRPDGNANLDATYIVEDIPGGDDVVAMSSVPKSNPGIGFNDSLRDLAPVVTEPLTGKVGYLWSHIKYGGIKKLLEDSGYYYEYADMFDNNHPNNWFYIDGLRCCNKQLVDNIFREIENKEIKKAKLRAVGLDD